MSDKIRKRVMSKHKPMFITSTKILRENENKIQGNKGGFSRIREKA